MAHRSRLRARIASTVLWMRNSRPSRKAIRWCRLPSLAQVPRSHSMIKIAGAITSISRGRTSIKRPISGRRCRPLQTIVKPEMRWPSKAAIISTSEPRRTQEARSVRIWGTTNSLPICWRQGKYRCCSRWTQGSLTSGNLKSWAPMHRCRYWTNRVQTLWWRWHLLSILLSLLSSKKSSGWKKSYRGRKCSTLVHTSSYSASPQATTQSS